MSVISLGGLKLAEGGGTGLELKMAEDGGTGGVGRGETDVDPCCATAVCDSNSSTMMRIRIDCESQFTRGFRRPTFGDDRPGF